MKKGMPENSENKTEKKHETISYSGIELNLCEPDFLQMRWIGQQDVMDQLLASWYVLSDDDIPLNPRVIGKPGVGKTTLAYAASNKLKRDCYIFQATMDTRPEDLIITPVISTGNTIKYVASSLVTAMIRGGVCILDEGNRMSEKSWASLAPLLDRRRYVESIIAGIKIQAHPDFLFCTTMNEDSSTFELPEYIHSRLQPQIRVDFPERDEELIILRENLPFCKEELLLYVADFLQRAHKAGEKYTVRDGINIGRFAAKLIKHSGKKLIPSLESAVIFVLGEEAIPYCNAPKIK